MSSPSSVGIHPASANEDVFKASGRLVLKNQVKGEKGRTRQIVAAERKDLHVDKLAEFRGDRPCQRKTRTFLTQVVDSYYQTRPDEQASAYRSMRSSQDQG
jgi:hypothetical protein